MAQHCAVYCTSSCLVYSCTLQRTTSVVHDIIYIRLISSLPIRMIMLRQMHHTVLPTNTWNCTFFFFFNIYFMENVSSSFSMLFSLFAGRAKVHNQFVRRFVCTHDLGRLLVANNNTHLQRCSKFVAEKWRLLGISVFVAWGT